MWGFFSFLSSQVLQTSVDSEVGLSSTGASYVGEVVSFLFQTSLYNASEAGSLRSAANLTRALDLASAAQLFGSFDGVGYALTGPGVSLYSYRSEAGALLTSNRGGGAAGPVISLASTGDATTSAVANFSVAALEALVPSGGVGGLTESSLLDARIATLGKGNNPYARALKGSAGSAAAQSSRADQPPAALAGQTLLRSKITVVELTVAGAVEPLAIQGLSPDAPVFITLGATVPFNATAGGDKGGFVRTRPCSADGSSVTVDCPLGDVSYTCDFAAHGGGKPYTFDMTCPRVVPTCLFWDSGANQFSSEGCLVVEGHATESVTCACTHLTAFALGANLTEATVHARGPTAAPTLAPTPADTVSVAVSLNLATSQASISASETAALKATVAQTSGVSQADMQGFAVTVTPARRRALLAQAPETPLVPPLGGPGAAAAEARRLPSSYTWAVSFTVQTGLVASGHASAAGLASSIASSLTSGLAAAVQTDLGLAVTVAQVDTAVENTRAPTKEPTAGPTDPPSSPDGTAIGEAAAAADSEEAEGADEAKSPSSELPLLLIGAAGGGALGLCLAFG